jgi:hypothetical protein
VLIAPHLNQPRPLAQHPGLHWQDGAGLPLSHRAPLLTPPPIHYLAPLLVKPSCIRGFSVQGRIEKTRRNYTEMWEQIGGHKRHHKRSAVSNFKLNILGETVEAFTVPGGWLRGAGGELVPGVRAPLRHLGGWVPQAHFGSLASATAVCRCTAVSFRCARITHQGAMGTPTPSPSQPQVEVKDLVAVYKNPPYPIFYDVVAHSFALVSGGALQRPVGPAGYRALKSGAARGQRFQRLQGLLRPQSSPPTCICRLVNPQQRLQVPMLASDLYYKSKFSSTVLTSLITGEATNRWPNRRLAPSRDGPPASGRSDARPPMIRPYSSAPLPCSSRPTCPPTLLPSPPLCAPSPGVPMIADQRLLEAYSMLDRDSVFYQVRASWGKAQPPW